MNTTLEGMARATRHIPQSAPVSKETEQLLEYDAIDLKLALLWLADRMEENGELTTDCKRAAVSAYLAPGQDGRGMVEPVRLMKAISAALRAAAGEIK